MLTLCQDLVREEKLKKGSTQFVGGIKISVVYTVQDTDGKILFSYLTA
jgi:hypothetical protein